MEKSLGCMEDSKTTQIITIKVAKSGNSTQNKNLELVE